MQKAIKHVIFLYMIFLALLFFSGGAEGAASTALYYIAFLLPLCIMLGLYRRDKYEREQERGLREEWIQPLKPSVLGLRLTLPLIAPTVLFTLLLSNLIGLLLTSLGIEAPTNEVGNLALDLLSSALAPAVLEEMLFRLAPLMLVAPRCRRKAFVLSTVCFALVHGSVFTVPYALFAGAVLSFLASATGGVLFPIIVHFVNNTTSVLIMHFGESFFTLALWVLVGLSAVSAVLAFLFRRDYRDALRLVFEKGERGGYPVHFYVYVGFTLLLTLSSLL